jgi:hypothetical protein
MNELQMELRAVDPDARTITGIVAPYDAVSYMTPDPAGERIMRGAFKKSIAQRGNRVLLCRSHNHDRPIGMARDWIDADAGLSATFTVRAGVAGDEALEDARDGYLGGLSVGFKPLVQSRGQDGAREIREAALLEVSLVSIPAYEGARVLAVRSAQDLSDLLKPFANRPAVNLSPIPAVWLYDSAR